MANELNRGILQARNVLPDRGVAQSHNPVAWNEPGRLRHLYKKTTPLVLDEKVAIGFLQRHNSADLHKVAVLAAGIELGQIGDGYLFWLLGGGLFDDYISQARNCQPRNAQLTSHIVSGIANATQTNGGVY